MKHTNYIPKRKIEHGGVWALHRRRSRRRFSARSPLHLVLRSDLARGRRSLLRNKAIVDRVLKRFALRFRIRVYEKAVCGNHIHLLVKAQTRYEMQHFFRVFAGQVAQEILRQYPLQKHEEKAFWGGTPEGARKSLRERWGGTPAVGVPGASESSPPRGKKVCAKNQRTFWSLLIYSRIVAWGRDFGNVGRYLQQNVKEALGLIPYQERKTRFRLAGNTS